MLYYIRRRSLLDLLALVGRLVDGGQDHTGEGEQSDGVGQDHQVVEHVGELPNQVVGHHSAQIQEHQSDDGITLGGLFAKEIDDVDLAEQIPAEHGGKGKEEQTHGHKGRAHAVAQHAAEGQLGQVGLVHALGDNAVSQHTAVGVQGADDDQGIQGQDDEGIDEHAHHGHHALIVGVLHIGLGVGVGGGAHTGLVGEQAALGALADGGLDGIAEGAADDGLGLEGILEDEGKGSGDILDAHHQDTHSAHQEDDGHHGHHLLGDSGQTIHAAQKDEAAEDDQHHAHKLRGHAKGGLEGGADGVGLDHAAHKAQGQRDGHGEEAGQELAEAALKGGGDVVSGAAVDGAVLVHPAGLDGQGGLSIDGSHAEEGDDPHPEDGAGTAGEDGAGGTHDVAGSHLGGNGGGQGLEGGHAAGLLAAVERQVAEHLAHTLAEEADLYKAGADGVPQTHADEQEHQDVIGQILVDPADHRIEHCLYGSEHRHLRSLLLRPWRTHRISPPENKHGPGRFRSTVHEKSNQNDFPVCENNTHTGQPVVFLCPFA